MTDIITEYCKCRDYLYSSVAIKVKTFMMNDIDNEFINFNIVKRSVELINNELLEKFPNIPESKLPHCRFKIHDKTREIEAGIQYYYNHLSGLTYLGTSEINFEIFDCYYRDSYEPYSDYKFIAVYGHNDGDYVSGSKTAEAEYYLGQITPLALSYGLAYEHGFIS